MEKGVIRAVGYRRVSMRDQLDGHSLDAQETNIREYVRSQGWQMVEIYTDGGISAKKDSQRPALERLIADAEKMKFDVVVVDKVDRFYRHLRGLLTALELLSGYAVMFVSVQEKLDFTTPWGKLTLSVLGTLAEVYLDNLRQETRKGKVQRARDGLWNGSIPYGYCNGQCSRCSDPNGKGYCPHHGQEDRSKDKLLVPHPIESLGVRLAYEWYLSGTASDASIAERMNAYSVRISGDEFVSLRQKGTPGKTPPGPFNRDMVRGMLTNIFYTGKIAYYGTDKRGKRLKRLQNITALYPGKHPALVGEDVFQQVQELRKLLSFNPRSRGETEARVYPLSSILRCGVCGGVMRGVAGTEGRRYYRDATQIGRSGNCSQPILPAGKIEVALARLLQEAVQGASDQVEAAKGHLADAQERYRRARLLFLRGDLTQEEYEQEKSRRDLLEKGLRKIIDGATMLPIDEIERFAIEWQRNLPIENKKLLRLVLETAFVRENAFVALQPTVAFLPLMGRNHHCNGGPDGS